ncbi:hypothetical protein BgiMline_002394, partial [Biomphalaria glabrata]
SDLLLSTERVNANSKLAPSHRVELRPTLKSRYSNTTYVEKYLERNTTFSNLLNSLRDIGCSSNLHAT